MGRRNVLVDGGTCTGKTAVASELQRRGHHVVHGDRELAYQGDPRTGEPVEGVTGLAVHDHHLWRAERVRALAADDQAEVTFFCGGCRNSAAFLDVFDEVVVLQVDRDTLALRLDQRPTDEWGGQPAERELVLRLHRAEAPSPPGTALDATGAPRRRRRRGPAPGQDGQRRAGGLSTRQAYDAVAVDYARLLPDLSIEAPLDRAVLAAFAELLAPDPTALVADVGCGTGRLTAHLHGRGLRTVGLDLSPGMAAVARRTHDGLTFAAADAAALPLRTGALGGLVAWYSLIHLPTGSLPGVFAEFARVTRPGALVLVAFQSGDGERVVRDASYGRAVPLTYWRHRLEDVASALGEAGFRPFATVTRAAVLGFESTPQAALLVHREAR
jgi:SAM-dependent methyltransferase